MTITIPKCCACGEPASHTIGAKRLEIVRDPAPEPFRLCCRCYVQGGYAGDAAIDLIRRMQ